jgi:hypothetical protein
MILSNRPDGGGDILYELVCILANVELCKQEPVLTRCERSETRTHLRSYTSSTRLSLSPEQRGTMSFRGRVPHSRNRCHFAFFDRATTVRLTRHHDCHSTSINGSIGAHPTCASVTVQRCSSRCLLLHGSTSCVASASLRRATRCGQGVLHPRLVRDRGGQSLRGLLEISEAQLAAAPGVQEIAERG